jgi:hypothetical protein
MTTIEQRRAARPEISGPHALAALADAIEAAVQ